MRNGLQRPAPSEEIDVSKSTFVVGFSDVKPPFKGNFRDVTEMHLDYSV